MTTQTPMKIIDTELDAPSAYKFNVTNRSMVGYIETMAFESGAKLTPDITVKDPENPDQDKKVVGILDSIQWVGGPTDPVMIKGRLSFPNKGTFKSCVTSLTGGADINIAWCVESYDGPKKKYFKAFHTNEKEVKAVITDGTETKVKDIKSVDITDPENFAFELTLTAKSGGEEQELCCATSAELKFSRRFGIKMG
ncbi:MAG: hypothetical protein ACRDFB_00470 [Rhabdochlamydiaceae bacterium]